MWLSFWLTFTVSPHFICRNIPLITLPSSYIRWLCELFALEKVWVSSRRDMRAKQWDSMAVHYSNSQFPFNLLPLCITGYSQHRCCFLLEFPFRLLQGQWKKRDCSTIDLCGLFLEDVQVPRQVKPLLKALWRGNSSANFLLIWTVDFCVTY